MISVSVVVYIAVAAFGRAVCCYTSLAAACGHAEISVVEKPASKNYLDTYPDFIFFYILQFVTKTIQEAVHEKQKCIPKP